LAAILNELPGALKVWSLWKKVCIKYFTVCEKLNQALFIFVAA
jgi:hypothetical protein